MGFRFRKSIKIAPGVKINLGGNSASMTIGKRGASVNVGKNGVRGTIGIPGSGLSYSESIIKRQSRNSATPTNAGEGSPMKTIILVLLFFMAIGIFLVPSH